ncbi:glycosylated lysosomal membrane protein B-like [Babylonia areolata]|uniref:glycosylated lysosomal membrane protein B-like n=1 Tax=Babylonia areolata TaxID=304850 RepID=UPI003FD6ACD3
MANGRMFCTALIVTLFTVFVADASKRNVTTKFFPDCEKYPVCNETVHQNATAPNASFPNMVYVRSSAGKDVLHFVMTTVKVPSILVVHTQGDANQNLSFNWDSLLANSSAGMEGAISSSGSGHISYSFVLAFSKLIEYDDIHDAASLADARKDNNTLWNVRNFTEFKWMNATQGQGGNSIIFNTTSPQLAPYGNNTEGSMYFEFEINSDEGRDADLPRLIYNANNTQMNFVLDKYVPKYNKSRFALEMTIVANHTSQDMSVEETKSIDDEYSPGVFRVVNWYSAGKSNKGYVQWKPVCYLAAERARAVGTEVMRYDLQNRTAAGSGVNQLLEESLAQAFFGRELNDSKTVTQRTLSVSFGLSQDGFYLKNNYTAWTASVGYGKPPVEGISTLVIVIIAAGLGIPVVIILFGSIYVCVRKQRRRGGYEVLGSGVSATNPQMN